MVDPEAEGYRRQSWSRRWVDDVKIRGIRVTRRGSICVLESNACCELGMSALDYFAKLKQEGDLGMLDCWEMVGPSSRVFKLDKDVCRW